MYSEKKYKRNFIVNNNNNKIICTWSQSSKLPVCRSLVNHTTGGKSETKLSTLVKTNILNIVRCFAIKWLKYACNKGVLLIQIMANAFCPFSELSPFLLRIKLVIYYCF